LPKKSAAGAVIVVTPLDPAGRVSVQTPPEVELHEMALIAGDEDCSE
jgi:hypothetical protein